jgi:hypothetical protein
VSLESEASMPFRLAVITTVLAVSDPVTTTNVWPVIEKYGIIAVLLIFFIWRDFSEKKNLIERINKIEDERAKEQQKVISANTKALEKVANVIQDCPKATLARRTF